jgi:hypothetical protein
MGLFNDAYDIADVLMTKREKGSKEAAKKQAEIKVKKSKY